MKHAIAICLIVSLMIPACDGRRDERVEEYPSRRIRSVMSWERSLADSIWVGMMNGDCGDGQEYDSGEVIGPAQLSTFDSAGNRLSTISLDVDRSAAEEDIFSSPQSPLHRILTSTCIIRGTFYSYDTLPEGTRRLRMRRLYVECIPLFRYLPDIFSLVNEKNLVREEQFDFNHRGDTARVVVIQSYEEPDTTWFNYDEAGLLENQVTTAPFFQSCFGVGKSWYPYDTLYRHYGEFGQEEFLLRYDSLGSSHLYCYDTNGSMRKTIRFDGLGNYNGETEIDRLGMIGRVEHGYAADGTPTDRTYFDAAGFPLLSFTWKRRLLNPLRGDYPTISVLTKSIPDTQPLLIKEYHYEWW